MTEPVDIDHLTKMLSQQNFRAARRGMYRALRELRDIRAAAQPDECSLRHLWEDGSMRPCHPEQIAADDAELIERDSARAELAALRASLPSDTGPYFTSVVHQCCVLAAEAAGELAALQQRIKTLCADADSPTRHSHWGLVDTRGLRAALAGAAPAEPEPSSAELERMLTDPDDGVTIVRGER